MVRRGATGATLEPPGCLNRSKALKICDSLLAGLLRLTLLAPPAAAVRCTQVLAALAQRCLPQLAARHGAAAATFSSSCMARGLEELLPSKRKEEDGPVVVGVSPLRLLLWGL